MGHDYTLKAAATADRAKPELQRKKRDPFGREIPCQYWYPKSQEGHFFFFFLR